MLSSIRRFQKGILIAVTIVICIAFAWLYNEGGTSVGGNTAFEIYERKYRPREGLRMANFFNVAFYDMGGQIPFNPSEFGEFGMELYGKERMDLFTGQIDRTEFIFGLLTLRHEAKKLGIQPSAASITNLIQEQPVFQGPDGNFDPSLYEDYLKERLGRYGLAEADLIELAADVLRYRGLRVLTGSGMMPSEHTIDEAYREAYETITANQIVFPREVFAAGVEVTDDEVAEYYEANSASILAPEKRSLEYVFFAYPESAEDASPEQIRAARNEVSAKGNNAYMKFYNDEGEQIPFEDVAESQSLETVTTEVFAPNDPPEALVGENALFSALFQLPATAVGETALPVDTEKGIYIYRMTEVKAPEPMPLEDARDQIQAELLQQNVDERIQAAALAAREKIRKGLEEGLSFEKASKDLPGAEIASLEPFLSSASPAGTDYASQVSRAAMALQTGDFSEMSVLPDGSGLLVHVANRELLDRETEAADREAIRNRLTTQYISSAFTGWFSSVRAEAGAERLNSIEAYRR